MQLRKRSIFIEFSKLANQLNIISKKGSVHVDAQTIAHKSKLSERISDTYMRMN